MKNFNEPRPSGPLRCVPRAVIVRERLRRVLDEAAQLKVLLQTAEAMEQATSPAPDEESEASHD